MESRGSQLRQRETVQGCAEVAGMKWLTDVRTEDICWSHNETWFKSLPKIKVQDSRAERIPYHEGRGLIWLMTSGEL